LSRDQLACGGGDQIVNIYDVTTAQCLSILNGHTESIKAISTLDDNPFLLATGGRDGSILIFDTRCNRLKTPIQTTNNQNTDDYSHIYSIRSINNIYKAHFFDSNPQTPHSTASATNRNINNNILRTRTTNISTNNTSCSNHKINSSLSLSKKATPVSCVLFQNESLVVSAGVTDGSIKVWDIRKLYLPTSHQSKHHRVHGSQVNSQEATPLHIFDNPSNNNETLSSISTPSNQLKSSKGFSSFVLNHSKTKLYANCMNSCIYEYDMVTFDTQQSRILNSNGSHYKPVHVNQSNFIKSSISPCGNYLLTGSSDFTAYIYNINNCKTLPVDPIALKAHTNEVTTVAWNNREIGQLVTCSDDNTIRLWNVRQDIDLESMKQKECNYFTAEIRTNTILNDSATYKTAHYDFNPYITSVHDDFFFKNEKKRKFTKNKVDNLGSVEDELCEKYEKVDINKDVTPEKRGDTSLSLSFLSESMEQYLKSDNNLITTSDACLINTKKRRSDEMTSNEMDPPKGPQSKISKLNNKIPIEYLQNFPIRIRSVTDERPQTEANKNDSISSQPSNIFDSLIKTNKKQDNSTPLSSTKVKSLAKNSFKKATKTNTTPSVSVKRTADYESSTPSSSVLKTINEVNNKIDTNVKTPQSKRRLIMSSSSSSPISNGMTPSDAIEPAAQHRIKTILHYFSPKAH
jgi:WD40 repeat protein